MIAIGVPQNFHLSPIYPISSISVAITNHVNSLRSSLKQFYDAVTSKQHYAYSSFGELQKVTDINGNDLTLNPILEHHFAYTGREYDQESGLYHYRARAYDASTGRFLQVDPDPGKLKNPQDVISKFIYVTNNPINFVDPLGKFKLNLGLARISMSKEHLVQTVAIAAMVTLAIVAPASIPVMLKGAAIGAGISGSIALATGGDVGKAMIHGAIIGGLAAGTGFAAKGWLVDAGMSAFGHQQVLG